MSPWRARSSRHVQDDRGSATAETAVVLPVVVVLVVVLAFLGLGITEHVRVENAARVGTRELARGEDTAAATTAARRAAGPGAQVSVSRQGDWVQVTVTRRIAAGSSGALAGFGVTVEGSATCRLEPQLLGSGGSP